MEERISCYKFHGILLKKVLVTALFIFTGLHLFISKQIALGFVVGVFSSLLIRWLSWEGLNNIVSTSNPQSIGKKRAQRIAVQGYLASYLLLGVILWMGMHFVWLNFYAVACGFLLPQIFIRLYTAY